jgi:hypothetical protein
MKFRFFFWCYPLLSALYFILYFIFKTTCNRIQLVQLRPNFDFYFFRMSDGIVNDSFKTDESNAYTILYLGQRKSGKTTLIQVNTIGICRRNG